MNVRRSRSFLCAAFVFTIVLLAWAAPAFADGPGWSWQNGTFTALPDTPELSSVTPLGISPNGAYIVGYGVGTAIPIQRALIWHKGAATELGTLYESMSSAYDVNNAGHAVGGVHYTDGTPLAAIFAKGQVKLLRTEIAYSLAGAINKHDLVVGRAEMTDGHTWAFAWESGVMKELEHLPDWEWSAAHDVNDAGQIVGMAVLIDGTFVAVEWTNGVAVVLPDLKLGQGRYQAFSINKKGDIAGSAQDENGNSQAVVWRDGEISEVLGTLGGESALAMGINNSGRVVGTSQTGGAGAFHAFLYHKGMTDLGTLPPWLTSQARAISDKNIVIGCNDYF